MNICGRWRLAGARAITAPLSWQGTWKPSREPALPNRGWVSQGQSRSDLPSLEIVAKKSRIIGTITSPEQGVLAGSEILTNEWPLVSQTKSVEVIASAFKEPILDIVLVLDPGSSQIAEFIQIKPFAITPVKHYGYAMQWFTMSIVLLGMFLYALKREK